MLRINKKDYNRTMNEILNILEYEQNIEMDNYDIAVDILDFMLLELGISKCEDD